MNDKDNLEMDNTKDQETVKKSSAKKLFIIISSSVVALVVIVFVVLFAYRFGQRSIDATEYADAEFISTMDKNLTERNKMASSKTTENQDAAYYENLVAIEDSILEFEDATFKDEHLKKLALDYIDGIKLQKEAVEYISDVTKFNETWQQGLNERSVVISELIEDYDLNIPDEIVKDFTSTAKIVNENNAEKEAVSKLFESMQFEKTETIGDYSYYQATVENTTGYDFEYVNLSINLLKNDVIVETVYSNIGVWQNGVKAQFEFQSNKEFDRYEVHGDYSIDK